MFKIIWQDHKIEFVATTTEAFDKIKAKTVCRHGIEEFKKTLSEKGHFVNVYGFSETWVFVEE